MAVPSFAGCSDGALLAAGTSAGAATLLPTVLLFEQAVAATRVVVPQPAACSAAQPSVLLRAAALGVPERSSAPQALAAQVASILSSLGCCKRIPRVSACHT